VDERVFVQGVQQGDDGQAADEFGNEAEFDEVFRFDLLQEAVVVFVRLGFAVDVRAEADTAVLYITDRELFENWLYNDRA